MSPAARRSTGAGVDIFTPAAPAEMPEQTATPSAHAPADETAGKMHPPRTLPPRPEKPVRFTLDLDRDRHRFLKEYALSIEADASQVVRALLDELRDGANLQARVWARIWQPR